MSEYNFQSALREMVGHERLARRILGVSPGDGPEKVRKAFWLLAMRYHPDRTPGDEESERRFRNIVNAYEYLSKGGRANLAPEGQEEGPPRRTLGYRVENAWGYYLWWRDSFFDEHYGLRPGAGGVAGRGPARARVDPRRYDAWYRSGRGARIDAEEKSALSRVLGPGRGARLLDVGCGTGHFTRWYAGLGYRAFGIDISRSFVRYARARGGARFAVADGSRLPFADNAFHAAVAIAVLEFAPSPEQVVWEMRRVAGRTLLLLMLNPDSDLNAGRRRRPTGMFSSARFWQPQAAVRFLMDILPLAARGSVRKEIHADFYVMALKRASP